MVNQLTVLFDNTFKQILLASATTPPKLNKIRNDVFLLNWSESERLKYEVGMYFFKVGDIRRYSTNVLDAVRRYTYYNLSIYVLDAMRGYSTYVLNDNRIYKMENIFRWVQVGSY